MSRSLVAGVIVAAITVGGPAVRTAATAPPTDAEVRTLVARAAKRPSVHADRHVIDEALAKAGVAAATIERLWPAVDAAVLPACGTSLEAFLLLAPEPEWLALRDEFAEFLTLRGIGQIDKKTVSRLRSHHGIQSFPDLTELDVASAKRLRSTRDDWGTAVELPAVRSLTPAVAEALARCPATLLLPGLADLSAETAAALARHEGAGLVLGGIRRLDPPVAEALAAYPPHQTLLVPDLESLDSIPLARRLAAQDVLYLPRVPAVTVDVAAALEGGTGCMLVLPGIVELSESLAERLVQSGFHGLTLGCGGTLSAAAARALAPHPGPLVFTGTQGLAVAAAAALDSRAGDLVLQHVARLPGAVAAALAGHDHLLVLPGVRTLDATAAADLAVAGPLSLPAVRVLDEPAATALADHAHRLHLDGLRELPAAVARALGRHRGDLMLGGLEALDAATAAGLATCPGQLHLDAVTRIDRTAAAILLRRRDPLWISGLQGVERIDGPEVARLIAARIDDPALPSVTAIDGPDAVAIAAALAESRGELLLPALKRITPRALSALLRKRELEIPDLADITVVPDPGGGADDFVDPR